jgi:lysozyme
MNRTALVTRLVQHEGLRLKPYTDTVGKLTIGVGRNLTDDGITECEARTMLDNDINTAFKFCQSRIACFGALNDVRQNVLVEMAFNLGGPKLLQFTQMLAALERADFAEASKQMLDSAWAKEVGDRAQELAKLMKDGA